MATVHLSLSPQLVTGIATLIVSILTYVAAHAADFVSPTYQPLVAFIAGSVTAFVVHNYYTPTPTANAGAPSTVAGPPV